MTMKLSAPFEPVPAPDAELWLARKFLHADASAWYFAQLRGELAWQQGTATLFGRSYPIPRLQAWYGDRGCRYAYTGMHLEPLVWTATLLALREQLAETTRVPINSVLANLYRDGHDGVGWHSDDDPAPRPDPPILSLSLGAMRVFQLRHRTRRDIAPIKLELASVSWTQSQRTNRPAHAGK